MRALTMDEAEIGGIRELTAEEVGYVSGALSLFGGAVVITEIAAGMELAAVCGVAASSFGAGYWAGGYIYEGLSWAAYRWDWW